MEDKRENLRIHLDAPRRLSFDTNREMSESVQSKQRQPATVCTRLAGTRSCQRTQDELSATLSSPGHRREEESQFTYNSKY